MDLIKSFDCFLIEFFPAAFGFFEPNKTYNNKNRENLHVNEKIRRTFEAFMIDL
jgi:hypothetical protein